MHTSFLNFFKNRSFLPFFSAQFLGALNDNLFRTALVTLIAFQGFGVAKETQSTYVIMAMGLFMLPFFLFSALAGEIADKYRKATLIKVVKGSEVLIMGFALFAFLNESANLLLVALFFMGVHSAVLAPVKYSILPELLNKEDLLGGNGLVEAGTFLAILLGSIFGGLLATSANAGVYAVAPVAGIIAVLGFVASLFIPAKQPANKAQPLTSNIFISTFHTIKLAKENRSIYLSILGVSWFWFLGSVLLSQMPNFAKDVLFGNEQIFTLLLTLFALGIGCGSVACNKLLKGVVSSKYVPISAILMSVFLWDAAHTAASFSSNALPHTVFGFLSTFNAWRLVFDLFMMAFFGGLFTVPLYTLMQVKSPEAHRSQTIAANSILNALFMVMATGITLLLVKMGTSIPMLFKLLAYANVLVAIYICVLLPETVLKFFMRNLFRLLFRVEIVGLENFDKTSERTVIIANHTSFLDAATLAVFLPEKLTFAVNTHIAQKPLIRLFLSLVKAYPVDPSNPMATKHLINVVKNNEKLVIFPEGRLTVTGSLMKVYDGPGMIADKADADILPIHFTGADQSLFSRLKHKYKRFLFPKITMTIFPPRKLKLDAELKGRARRHGAGEKLYTNMRNMTFDGININTTLFEALLKAKQQHGNGHPILEDINRKPLSYRAFVRKCLLLSKVFEAETKMNTNVGLLLPNMVSAVVSFFALQFCSRVPAMLNYTTGSKNLLLACETAQIETVYTSKTFIERAKLEGVVHALNEQGVRVEYLENVPMKIRKVDFLKTIAGQFFAQKLYTNLFIHNKAKPDPNAPAVILFTSGSEGVPKGVALSHKNLLANRAQLASCIDFSPTDTVFNALPIFHSFGLTGGTLLPLLSGVKTFLYPSPLHYRIVPELVYDTNSTILFGTDTFLSGYAKYASNYDFYSIRYVFAGAEKLKETTQDLWSEKFGIRIFEGYGATETSPVLSTNTPMHTKSGTVGRLMPGIEHRLEPVPGIEEGGKLLVKGPNVMLGYLRHEKPGFIEPLPDGWYDTGDIVTIDAQGYISIKGRAKRFAKVGGEMVSLGAVEGYLQKLWPDAEHAVVAVPDEKKGEQLALLTTQPDATRQVIVAYVKEHGLPDISVPKEVKVTDKIPLLGSGKTDYPGVKAAFE